MHQFCAKWVNSAKWVTYVRVPRLPCLPLARARIPGVCTLTTDAHVSTAVSRGEVRLSPKSWPSPSCAHTYVRAYVRTYVRVHKRAYCTSFSMRTAPSFFNLQHFVASRPLAILESWARRQPVTMAAALASAEALETQAGGRARADEVKPEDVCGKEGDREAAGLAEDFDGRSKLKRSDTLIDTPSPTGEGGGGGGDGSDDASEPSPKKKAKRMMTRTFRTLPNALSCAQHAEFEFAVLEAVEPCKKDYERKYNLTFEVVDEWTGPETDPAVIEGSSDSLQF